MLKNGIIRLVVVKPDISLLAGGMFMEKRIAIVLFVLMIIGMVKSAFTSVTDIQASEEPKKEVTANFLDDESVEETIGDVMYDNVDVVTVEGNEKNNMIEINKPIEPQKINEYYDEYFGEIMLESEYIADGNNMPYVLYTPSTLDEEKKTPLIVWLHGSGEVGVDSHTFMRRGLPEALSTWELEGFNAYIMCPHLAGKWNVGRWNAPAAKDNLKALIDEFIQEHKIDTENVLIVGHSLGGQGVLYMAHELTGYFSKGVVLSGYTPGVEISEIEIPMLGFVGTTGSGEDGASVSYMKNYFAKAFGEENLFQINTSHGMVPEMTFNIDSDGNNRSDVIEWFLGFI